ncbi:peptide ABC transporter substrate-binding protein, partial [Candidatus Parcubacteria bacterium]
MKNKFQQIKTAIVLRLKNAIYSLKNKQGAKKAEPTLAIRQVVNVRKNNSLPTGAQLKYFPKLLNKNEKKLAAAALLIVLFSGGALMWHLLGNYKTTVPAVGGEYTEGLIGTPQLINPLYSLSNDTDNDLTRLIYSGLMKYDNNGELVNDLAKSYTISDDGKTYTFTIRDNARWHDGEQVMADDIIFTISAIKNPDYNSPFAASFANVEVEQVDDKTVNFTLQKPLASFPALLTIGILPSHLWQEVSPMNATLTTLNKKPIGSGPYMFKKFVQDSNGNIRSYDLIRNPNYYNGAPYIETLHFKFYPDIKSGINALKNHNIEGLSYLPNTEITVFSKDSAIQILYPSLMQYGALFFNEKNNDALSNKQVKQALLAATDKNAIIQSLNNAATIANSFLIDGMPGYDSSRATNDRYNPEKAKQLLEEAGWSKLQEDQSNENQFFTKDEEILTMTITTLNSQELQTVAQTIKEQWESIGIKTNIKTINNSQLPDALKNKDYEIILADELYGTEPDPYPFWHSSQIKYPGLNLANFSNDDADDYIDKARITNDK